LDFVCKGLKGTALVRGGGRPVFLKLDDGLEAEGSGGDLWLEDPNEISGGGFYKVNDDRLRSDESVYLFTDVFGKGWAGETLF
jgi:hypothetical protein